MTYEALTGEFVVNSTTAGLQRSPSVTYLVGGGYVVTWQDESGQGGDPTGSSVRGQVYDAGGTPVGGEFVVNSTTLGNQADPAVAATPDGGFVVTWYDDSGTGGDASSSAIKARMFGADGTPVADEFLVNTATANQQIQPSIAMLVDGRFVITWADASADSGDSPYGIKAQIFGTDGTPLGGEFHMAHGLSIALLLPHVVRFNLSALPERHAALAAALGGGSVDELPDLLTRLIARCGIDARLSAHGIPRDALPRLADAGIQVTRLLKNNPRDVTREDALRIYEAAF